MTTRADIAIAGGGLNGASLALALARAGFEVALIEAETPNVHADPAFDGRSYALALTSQRLLAAIGLWPTLRDDAQPLVEIKVADGRPGQGPSPFFLHFDHAEIEEGPLGYMVEDRHLRPALLDRIAATPGITHLTGRRVTGHRVAGSRVVVDLDDGTVVSAALLAGCDGRASPTARRAGIGRTEWDYGQTALVCAIAHERLHGGVAHQLFLPSGPLAILPLRGDRSSIVWTEGRDEAQRIGALDEAGYLDALRPRFGDFLGGLKLAGKRFSYPLGLSLAQSFTAPRTALVGDAAHGIHPLAGQGLNAGLRDVAALVQVLTEARRRGEDIGQADVLGRFQTWRRFDTTALALATDGFNRLFSNDLPGLRTIRDLGLGLVNALPGLRRGFMREAAGLAGDLPELMR